MLLSPLEDDSVETDTDEGETEGGKVLPKPVDDSDDEDYQ